MKIQLLISTYNERIEQVEHILLSPRDDLSYLVSHQCTKEEYRNIPQALIRPDVTIFQISGTGISANRNNSIRCANGDVVVLLDDDVRLQPDYIEAIRSIFKDHPEVDLACCKIKTLDGEPEYKVYPVEEKVLHETGELKSISSIEISFRLKSILDKNIWFDERFGLGRKANNGEELLFLNACLKSKLTIRYFPVFTVEHPFQSTTKNQPPYSDQTLFATGAQAYVLYGRMAFLRNYLAAVRRWKDLKREGVSVFHFIRMKQAGSMFICKGGKDY